MIVLLLIQYCLGQNDYKEFEFKISEEKQELAQFFKIVNLDNTFCIITYDQYTKLEKNKPQIKFVQALYTTEFYLHQDVIGFQQLWENQKLFDDEWRFNRIVKHISNRQAVIIWSAIQGVKIIELSDQKVSVMLDCLVQRMLSDDQNSIQFIMTYNSQQYNNIEECQQIQAIRVSMIKSNEFINVDLDQRAVTLLVHYNNQQSFILDHHNYPNCQTLLNSINYELLRYIGFKILNIHLYITHLSKSINCTILYPLILVNINIYEQYQVSEHDINYIFVNFNMIKITNTTFQNRFIKLISDILLLTNIDIKDNPYIISINCSQLQIGNMRINKVFSQICINSDNLNMIINKLQFSDITIQFSSFIQLICNKARIEINQLSITNTDMESFYVIVFNIEKLNYTNIFVTNLNIYKSTLRNSTLFPISNNLELFKCSFIDAQFQSVWLFSAFVLKIQTIAFTNCQMMSKTILLKGKNIDLQNQSYLNCTFYDSYILNNHQYFPQLFLTNTISLTVYNLSLCEIFGDISYHQLIEVTTDKHLILQNVFIHGTIELSLFSLSGHDVNISTMQINKSHRHLLGPLLVIQAYNYLTMNDVVFHSAQFGQNEYILIQSNVTVINNIQFINLIATEENSNILRLDCLNLTFTNIIFTNSSELSLQIDVLKQDELIESSNTISIMIRSFVLSIFNFTINYKNNIQIEINSSIIIINQMNISCTQSNNVHLLQAISLRFMICNSIFNGLQQMLYLIQYSNTTQTSIAEFVNNSVYGSIQKVDYLYFLGFTFVSVINNTFQIENFYEAYIMQMKNIYGILIQNNIIQNQTRISKIHQLNESSSTLINNMTVFGRQCLITYSIIEITNGKVHIENVDLFNIHVLHGFQLISSKMVNLIQINAKQILNLINIISDLDLIIQLTNITITSITMNTYTPFGVALISISGSGISQIGINGLAITRVSSDSPINNFIKILANIQSIDITNVIFIHNNATLQYIHLEDNFKFLNKFRISHMIFKNQQYNSLVQSNMIILIEYSLIFLSKNNLMIPSEQGIIQNCEIIQDEDLFERSLKYEVVNTRLTLSHHELRKEIYVSFDYGLKYALNQLVAKNTYRVMLQNNKKYFYLPTGQFINNFSVFDVKSLLYRQQNLSFLFKSNDKFITQCLLYIDMNDHLYLRTKFNMMSNNFNNSIFIMKPGTIIQFQTICLDQEHESELYLYFTAKILNCQIGEVLLDNICQACNIDLQQYSVQINSTTCQNIDRITMLSVDRGLIFLKEGFWRPFISNTQIESCLQSNNCVGGYGYGNRLCATGYIGAICSECDLFNEHSSDTYYKNQWQICEKCDIGQARIVSQLISFIISGFLIIISVLAYRKLVKKHIIIQAVSNVHQTIIRYQYDIAGVYQTFLLDYIQNLGNISRNRILLLIPFDINIDFLTNTSFSFINMIDCLGNRYFDSNYWIYIRLFFIFTSYIHIFQIYLLLLSIFIILKRESYSYLLVSIAVLKVYQANDFGFFNQLILLAIPINFSGYQWIQGQKTLFYNTDLHFTQVQYVIFPIISIITIVLPIFFYQRIRQSIKLNASFTYFKYLYKESAAYQDIIQRILKYIMISLIYLLQLQKNTLLIILGVTLYFQYLYLQSNQPYFLKRLNLQCLSIYLWLYVQAMINGLIESNHISRLNYLLVLIFYVIFIILVVKCCSNLVKQLGKDHYLFLDKIRQYINKVFGTHIDLETNRKIRIQFYCDKIRNKLLMRHRPLIHKPATNVRKQYKQ